MIWFRCLVLLLISVSRADIRINYGQVFDVYDKTDLENNAGLKQFCNEHVCLRRCCSVNTTIYNRSCVAVSSSNTFDQLTLDLRTDGKKEYHLVNSHKNYCKNNYLPVPLRVEDVFLVGNKVIIPMLNSNLEYEDFCIEQEGNENATLLILACYRNQNNAAGYIGMIISMPFLLTTFLVYLLLPDKNVHQKALMLYVLSLLLAYVLLVAINLASNLSGGLCTSVGYLTLFFFMVSFFWMNVICFDIWYTFSGGRGYIGSRKNSENRRFLMYSAYAFGFPLLLLLVVFGMDKLPIDDRHKGKIGESKCFINDGWPQLWYLYLEAAILVIANILFFVLTALKIRQVKRETIMLKQSESKRHTFEKDKQRFNLFLKLLLAMGVNWSMEVISWLVNWITMDTVQYIWYLTDFVNAAYGVIIFFIFVFKKKIWRLLKKRYYNFIGKPNLARTVTTTETRTSHYSSTNYSNTDTHLTERTGVSGFNNGRRSEEIPLQKP